MAAHRRLAEGGRGETHHSAQLRVISRQGLPTAEERGHSVELVTMTAMKPYPTKREGASKRSKKSEREIPSLLVKVKTRLHKKSLRQAEGTENCSGVGWLPDRAVISL